MSDIEPSEQLRILSQSSDTDIVKLSSCFSRVFAGDFPPPQLVLDHEALISRNVQSCFPTPFADSYLTWRDLSGTFFSSLDGTQSESSEAFRSAIDSLVELWKMLLNFLPFLFMVSVNRMDRKILTTIAGPELRDAIKLYRVLFHESGNRAPESTQRALLVALLTLFRKLNEQHAIGSEFIFHPLMVSGDFETLFPRRLEALLQLIHEVRNHHFHKYLSKRPPSLLHPVYLLTYWSFLDLLDILTPVCDTFFMVYVTWVDVTSVPIKAKGLALSGTTPRAVNFRLPPLHQADSDKLHFGDLYVINRSKELGAGAAKLILEPKDYINLTPFLIYRSYQVDCAAPKDSASPTGAKDVFVFQEYDSTRTLLRFLQFAGKHVLSLSRTDSGVLRLFDEYESFRKIFLAQLDDLGSPGDASLVARFHQGPPPIDPETLRSRAWKISIGHLASLVDEHAYDDCGRTIQGGLRAAKMKFTEDLFVVPSEAAVISQFLISDKRGLILVGGSGSGKSNLLCHSFLEQHRSGALTLFIDARRLQTSNIVTFLRDSVVPRLCQDWKLRTLESYLESSGRSLILFLDALNEYNNASSVPFDLIDNVISFISHSADLRNVRVIASCRTETWSLYKEASGRQVALDERYFFTANGDASFVRGFSTDDERQRLFSAYQKYYGLEPRSYEQLAPSVQNLLRNPFLMSLIAETYSNRSGGEGESEHSVRSRIPKDLDYFRVFRLLTERKCEDAKRLLRRTDRQADIVPQRIEQCLLAFSRLLFERVTAPSASEGGASLPGDTRGDMTDALPVDLLYKTAAFSEFLQPLTGVSVSIFDMVVDIGLVTRTQITERDYWGNLREGRAYRCFHDQYAQYCLAALYNSEVLGTLPMGGSADAVQQMARLCGRISFLITRAVNAPILAGAIDQWLYANTQGRGDAGLEAAVALSSELAKSRSGTIRYYVGCYISGLILKDLVDCAILYKSVLVGGSPQLKEVVAESFLDFWPALPPEALKAFVECCDEEREDLVLRRLADVFAQLFIASPESVLAYLDAALSGISEVSVRVLGEALLHNRAFNRQVTFLAKFSLIAVLTTFDGPLHMAQLRLFLRRKFKVVLDVLTDGSIKPRSIRGAFRKALYRKLEASGINQWDQAIGAQGGNDAFFVEDDGLVQRDILFDFLPYIISLHNDQFRPENLARGSEFRALLLKMLTFREGSVIGYIAAGALPLILRRHPETMDDVIEDLLAQRTRAAVSFANVILVKLAVLDRSLCPRIFAILNTRIIPRILEDEEESDWESLSCCLSIASMAFDSYWADCEKALKEVLVRINTEWNDSRLARLSVPLMRCCYYPEMRVGTHVLGVLHQLGYLTSVRWRSSVVSLLAGLLVRNPRLCQQAADKYAIEEELLKEARLLGDEKATRERDEFVYQVAWNEFITLGLASLIKVRYLLIKILVGGLVQSNCVEEYAKEFRRFVVETATAFLSDRCKEADYGQLAVSDALSETESQRHKGAGRRWVSRSRVQTAP